MRDHRLEKAPDFTNAALVMGAVNLTWMFAVVWAVFGFAIVAFLALGLNAAITRLKSARRD